MTGHGIRPMASLFQALFAFSLALLVWVSPAAAIRETLRRNITPCTRATVP